MNVLPRLTSPTSSICIPGEKVIKGLQSHRPVLFIIFPFHLLCPYAVYILWSLHEAITRCKQYCGITNRMGNDKHHWSTRSQLPHEFLPRNKLTTVSLWVIIYFDAAPQRKKTPSPTYLSLAKERNIDNYSLLIPCITRSTDRVIVRFCDKDIDIIYAWQALCAYQEFYLFVLN